MPQSTEQTKQPVDRARRFKFVAVVVGFSLVASVTIAILAGTGVIFSPPITSLVVDGLIAIATALSITYVGGSVVDYNGQNVADYFKRRVDNNAS